MLLKVAALCRARRLSSSRPKCRPAKARQCGPAQQVGFRSATIRQRCRIGPPEREIPQRAHAGWASQDIEGSCAHVVATQLTAGCRVAAADGHVQAPSGTEQERLSERTWV